MTTFMDRFIYRASPVNPGVYATRRFPKGGAGVVSPNASVTEEMPNRTSVQLWKALTQDAPPNANPRIVWDYKIPLGRRARLQSAIYIMTRHDVAAPNFFSGGAIIIQRNGRTYASDFGTDVERILQVDAILTAQGQTEKAENYGALDLFEQDRIYAYTVDSSTGGTMDWIVSAVLIEFDSTLRANLALASGLVPIVSGQPSQPASSGGGIATTNIFGGGGVAANPGSTFIPT